MIIIWPSTMAWEEWSQRTYGYIVDLLGTIIPLPGAERNWKDWATQLRLTSSLSVVPDPNVFETWQEWGDRVVEALEPVEA